MTKQSHKIVLFAPSPEQNYYWTRVPLSLLAAGSLVHEAGYKVVIITARERNWQELIREETKDALITGITTMTGYQIQEALLAARIAKGSNPKTLIVFGGWHPTILPVQTCEHPLVDVVVKGQGERALLELTECLISGGNLQSIKGLAYKKGGQIVETEPRQAEDINNFPPYSYGLLDCKKYLYKTDFGERTINYATSRGCPHRCTFCAEVIVNKRRWMALNSDRVIEDWEKLVKDYGIDGLTIDDNNFFVDKNRVIRICEGLLKKNIHIKWGDVNAHARDMLKYEDDVWALMKKAGLHGLLVGAESGLDEMLQLLNKDAAAEDVVRLREKSAKYNIKLRMSFIAGLPKTKDIKISLDDELKSMVGLTRRCYNISKNMQSTIFFYTPYPGSLLYKEAINQGLKEPVSLEEWANFTLNHPHLQNIGGRQKQMVFCINSSMENLYTAFMRTGKFEGYRIIKGSNTLRRFAWNVIDYAGFVAAALRWKFGFFRLPIEYYLTRNIVRLKENWDSYRKR